MAAPQATHVVIVGGGFAGVACARALVERGDVQVTLLDRNNYHQFHPLLYQVATSQLASSDVAYPLRAFARGRPNFDVKFGEAAEVNLAARSVTTAGGETYAGDHLVIAGGSQPNFFGTPGAADHAFPLYSLDNALRLRSRIIGLFEQADKDPGLVDRGALRFVIVGGGPTGVEVAGALAEMIRGTVASEYHDLATQRAEVHLVDHGPALLGPFVPKAHAYAQKVLTRDGVQVHLRTAVAEVGPDHVVLSDGTRLATHCVVWGGGIAAAPLAAATGLATGKGGRIDVDPTFTVAVHPGVHVAGDIANIPGSGGGTLPQLGSVAQQSGAWVARNILAGLDGKPLQPFHYVDKGIMAMIGRGAAVMQIGEEHPHELQGTLAFSAWLGVHAALLSGYRNRIDAFVSWAWDYFGKARGPQILDRSDAARIDWGDPDLDDEAVDAVARPSAAGGGT